MIRCAKISEIPHILTIAQACASHMIEKGIFQWNDEYPSKEAFANDIERNELYVLEKNSEIIGTIVVSTLMDAEYVPVTWLTPNNNNLYIHRLAVHPDFQGKGYAQKLMDFAETYGLKNGFDSIRLDTFSGNDRNQRFYEARGYRKLDDIYYPKQSQYPFHCYELVL